MNRILLKKILFTIVCILLLPRCVYTPTTGEGSKKFNVEYLRVWVDSYISTSVSDLSQYSDDLLSASERLNSAVSLDDKKTAISDCKSCYIKAISSLEKFIIYDDYNDRLCDKVNSFPVNTTLLDSYLNTPQELDKAITLAYANKNTLGFPAIEYVLYSNKCIKPSDTSTDYSNKANVILLLAKNINKQVKERQKTIQGNRDHFIIDNSASSSSSVSILLNNLISNIETSIRTNKLGYPLGIYGWGKHTPRPSTAEALYLEDGYSIKFLRYSLNSLHALYYGMDLNGGYGLKSFLEDYLDSRPGYRKEETIKGLTNAIDKAMSDLERINGNVKDMVSSHTDYDNLQIIYRDIQSIVFSLKTPVLGGLGIAVTYSDGEEGD